MKLKKRFTRKADDPMGALNDLSFLLIIYFLVIAGFNTNFGFLLNLPSKEKPRVVQKEDLLKLELNETGLLLFEDDSIDTEALEILVTENLKVHPNLTVSLVIDPEAGYQNFVEIIEVIRFLDVHNFSFRMEGEGTS